MLKTRPKRHEWRRVALAALAVVLLLAIGAAVRLPFVKESTIGLWTRLGSVRKSAIVGFGTSLAIRAPTKNDRPNETTSSLPLREFLPRLGIAVLILLALALLAKLFYQWLTAFESEEMIIPKERVLIYRFWARLPRQVTLSWRNRNRRSTHLTPLIDWDGEKHPTEAGAQVRVQAKGRLFHSASLILTDAVTIDANHAVEFVISVRLWPLRTYSKILELEFDTWTPVAEPPAGKLVVPDTLTKRPTAEQEPITEKTYERFYAERHPIPAGGPEAILLGIANEFIGGYDADHGALRRRLEESGLEIGLYSPFRVQDSANCVFTRHWFRPDHHAGAWLWFDDHGQFMAIPFDRSQLKAETMRHFLASMYEGVGAQFGQQTGAKIEAACKLVRAREEDEYQVVEHGRFSAASDRIPSAAALPSSWSTQAKRQSESDEESSSSGSELLARVEALEANFVRFEARMGLIASQPKPILPSSRSEMMEPGSSGRELLARIKIVETRSVQFQEMLAASSDFDDRLSRLEKEVTALKDDRRKEPLNRPVADAVRLPIPDEELPVAVVSSATEHREDEQPASEREDIRPHSWGPTNSAVVTAPRLPAWWKPTLVRTRITDPRDYLTTLTQTLSRLSKVSDSERVQIIHLVETDTPEVYDVHFGDEIALDDTLVGRCIEKPGARVPQWQFFIAWSEPSTESIWVLCPPGSYPAIGFGYSSLIRDTASGEFSIAAVRVPARLEPTQDRHYKVASQMGVTFA